MKRGTQVRVSFTGKLDRKPVETGGNDNLVRVRVDGLPGWIAIVPESSVAEITEVNLTDTSEDASLDTKN